MSTDQSEALCTKSYRNGLVTSFFLSSFIINNRHITATCEEGSQDLQALEPLTHTCQRIQSDPRGSGFTSRAFPDVAAPVKRNHACPSPVSYPYGREHYLRRILTLGKPSHFSLHSDTLFSSKRPTTERGSAGRSWVPTVQGGGLTRMS